VKRKAQKNSFKLGGDLLNDSFFLNPTPFVAHSLIGCVLQFKDRCFEILETEAYTQEDPASHSYLSKKTLRNEAMFSGPGTLYVYRIYGMYYCLNIVTEPVFRGCAVLIRSVQDLSFQIPLSATNGPGKLCRTLGIDLQFNQQSLFANGSLFSIYSPDCLPTVGAGSRIGISKGKDLLWRFYKV